MSERIFLVYRRGMCDITARLLTAHLQLIEMHLVSEPTRALQRDHILLVLTPGTLERCLEPNDMMRNILKDAQRRNMRLITLASRHFDALDQARYAAGLLTTAEPLFLDYAQWEDSLQRVAQLLNAQITLPPLRPEQRIQLAAQERFEYALSLPASDLSGKFAAYSEAIRLYPDFAEAYARRAGAHLANNDLAACLADCETALRLNPNLSEAHHSRAMALARQGAYSEALESYSVTLRIDSRNTRAYLNRGVVKVNLGDIDGAIEDYTAAIDLNPELAEAYFNRSLAYGQRDNFEAAIQDYTRAMALHLNVRQAADEANISATIAYLERMLRRFPDHPQAELLRHEITRLRNLAND
ncbi:MAG: tetratricopeptide repeat protein [Aggregatilineales bacterium]